MSQELIWLIGIIVVLLIIVFLFLRRKNADAYVEYDNSEKYQKEIIQLKDEIIHLKDIFYSEKTQLLENSQKEVQEKILKITDLEQQLIEQQAQFKITLDNEIKQAQKRSNNTQRNVIKGQMAERFVPFMNGFLYNPSDCRFLGEPIDYITFHNLHQCADGEVGIDEVVIVFLEVKTGNAKLNKRQEILKEVIARGQIKFETLRIENDYPIVTIDKNASTTLSSQYTHEEYDDDDINQVGRKWTTDEEERLIESFELGLPISEIADIHGRKVGGIRRRLRKLGKIE